MKKLTIEDVAQRAGVSKSTVSQYLNKRYKYMSEATKQKIAQVIEELNYQPNGLAKGLKQNRSYMVGIIVANIDYSLSIQCIRAIENELQNSGIQVIICNADENPDKESKYIEMLAARQVDGLIVFPTGTNTSAYNRLIDNNYPLVFLDRLVDGIMTQSLLLDNEMAAKMAIQELVQHHHERIAWLSLPIGVNGITPRKERLSGYKRAMEEYQLPINEQYICSATRDEIASVLKNLLELPKPPTAILASNDIVLAEILKFANHSSLRIPEDLSVIGIDDAEFAHIYNPVITTITQPAYEMGMQAAKIILSCIEESGESVPITYRFPPTLRQGKSVKDNK
ncbi:LacI family DNA-binding transcriptional regulator [Paenibacillus segetis]|uniref:LacI family transcriptional regulator n=1 Tax=Paenibacillus segetis TaxID=1325360 RepID=A0ABQ1YLH6_9BACL|nr:LacI family DNA-binding transcriptional regulator [Paenibacillus segetis]GGH29804.1 LacI family transcriptional regulator [Paenibacillus segetis]